MFWLYADMWLVSKGAALRTPLTSVPGARRRWFEEIYAANHDAVLGYVLRRTKSPDDAADVIAETFLTAWRRLDDVPGGAARLWLYGVARRVLANHHRGERRRTALADRLRADLAAAYRAPQHTAELAEITAAFRGLPAADQELLALAAWEGLNTGQIATVLGCSPNAARIRRHRARRRFTRLLASYQAAAPPIDGHVTNGDLA